MSARATQERERAAKAVAALRSGEATMTTTTTTTTTLLLVRHGETAWNAEGRLQGQLVPGPSLSDEGAAQARALGASLAAASSSSPSPSSSPPTPTPNAVFSSDLARAVETARAIAAAFAAPPQQQQTPHVQLPALRERDVGRLLEGVRRADAPSVAPEAFAALRRSARDPSLPLPGGGESLDAVALRVGTALLDIARAYPGGRVVVVSHGGAIHAARRYAEGAGGGGGGGGGSGSSGASFGPLPNGACCEFLVDARQVGGDGAARCPGGQWRRGWAIARWADCSLLGEALGAGAGTEGGGADAG